MTDELPLFVLTGFLGSGKTTLLRHLLRHPDMEDTAVIVNEFGDIGLDHDLLEAAQEDVILLPGGCLCCSVREDLAATIRRLLERRAAGKIAPFRRIVIETTGLADPVPLLTTLSADPRVNQRCRLHGLIVAVDAQHAIATLNRHAESARQVALADRLVITKADLVSGEALEEVCRTLQRLNGSAEPLVSAQGGLAPAQLLEDLPRDLRPGGENAARWLGTLFPAMPGGPVDSGHAGRYRSIAWADDRPVDWPSFGIWLTMLLQAHGDKILRVKGILDVAGAAAPVAVHGVQHVVHPLQHLASWPPGPRRSRLVFIVTELSEASLRASFDVFMRLSDVLPESSPAAVRAGGTGGIIGGHPVRRRMAPAWMKG